MAGMHVTSAVPEGWADLRSLLAEIVVDGVELYRWEEQFTAHGERRRAAHVVRSQGAPALEEVAAKAGTRLRQLGFGLVAPPSGAADGARVKGVSPAAEDPHASAIFVDDAERALTIATRPLPPQLVFALVEPHAWRVGTRVVPAPPPSEWPRDPTLLPQVASLLALASRVGPTRLARVDRFAELDLQSEGRFYAPTLRATLRGRFALPGMCAELGRAGYEEDGDAWVRETRALREEVRLRDGELDLAAIPSDLAGVMVAPLSRSRPPSG